MNIYQFAMQMEKDGENYYRKFSQKTNQQGLKRILILLANEEVKHYRVLEQLNKKEKNPQMTKEKVFENVKNIFIQIKDEGHDLIFDSSEADLYQKALEIEKKSRQFYSEKADEVEGENPRELLLRLAEEEKKHEFVLENLIEFIKRPQIWIENAEWYHFDEY